jgi:hypothetical protein
VRLFFRLLQLAYVRTVHADLAFVAGRNCRLEVINMNTCKAVFGLQVEMFMNGYLVVA